MAEGGAVTFSDPVPEPLTDEEMNLIRHNPEWTTINGAPIRQRLIETVEFWKWDAEYCWESR